MIDSFGVAGQFPRTKAGLTHADMNHKPKIQISETYTPLMEAPEIEVIAWWSLSNFDHFLFTNDDPARNRLTLTDGLRRYETEFGDVTERLDAPTIPPSVRGALMAEGYIVSAES